MDLAAVVPLVRVGGGAGDDRDVVVVDVLAGALVVLYAFDRGDGYHLVARDDLTRLGVDQPALAAAARDNLLDRLGELQILERPDGCGMVRIGGNLEASLLLVPQLWRNIGEILGDEILVAVPADDTVLFCGAGNEPTKRALRAARDRTLAVGDHPMSTDLFRFSGNSWQVEPV